MKQRRERKFKINILMSRIHLKETKDNCTSTFQNLRMGFLQPGEHDAGSDKLVLFDSSFIQFLEF